MGKQEVILRIEAPHFVAGVVLRRDSWPRPWTVVETAPILHYMKGWSPLSVSVYATKRGWPRPHVIVRDLP